MPQLAEPIPMPSRMRNELADQYAFVGAGQTKAGVNRWKGTGEHEGQTRYQPNKPGERKKAEPKKAAEPKKPAADVVSDRLDQMVAAGELSEGKAEAAKAKLAEPLKPEVGKPGVDLAHAVAEKLKAGGKVTSAELKAMATAAYGGTMAQGKYGYSDATDALEAGFNGSLVGATDPSKDLSDAIDQANDLAEKIGQLPTQTNRSGEKETHQQFSTPPHYAYALAWVANLGPDDIVLEPSAGTGCIAVQAANAGAEVHANELSERRAAYLADMLGKDNVTVENAEQISGILPGKGVPVPSVVLMNPPFSQTAGRLGDKKDLLTGARHINEALKMLAPGGRLVAVVGEGMSPESSRYRSWFGNLKGKYSLRANVGVPGDEYKKFGTSFGTRVLVIDKTQGSGGTTVSGSAKDIPELMTMLEGVRNERSGKRSGSATPAAAGGGGKAKGGTATLAPPLVPGKSPAGSAAGGVHKRSSGAGAPAGPGGSGLGVQPVPGGSGDIPAGVGRGAGTSGAGGKPRAPFAGDEAGKPGGKNAGGKSLQQPSASVPRLRPAEPVVLDRGPQPPEPLFTGTDRLGRKWVNGKLVAKDETQSAGKKPGAVEEPGSLDTSGTKLADGPLEPNTNADLGASLYEPYRPEKARVVGAKPHPSPIVESAAMSAVEPPDVTYTPHLSPDIIQNGILSEAQLEPVIYAGQAHQQFLPAAEGDVVAGNAFLSPDGVQCKLIQSGDNWRLYGSGTLHDFKSQEDAASFLNTHQWTNADGSPIKGEQAYRRGYFVGDGCVAAGTRLYNPITGEQTAIEVLMERGEPHWVLSLTENGFEPRQACVPFLKGVADLHRVVLDDGREVTVTGHHRFLTPDGWLKIDDGLRAGNFLACAEGRPACNLGFSPSTHAEGDPRWTGTPEDCLARCSACSRPCGEQPRADRGIARDIAPSQGGARERSLPCQRKDGMAFLSECSRRRCAGPLSRNSSYPSWTRGRVWNSTQDGATSSRWSAGSFQVSLRFLRSSSFRQQGGVVPSRQLACREIGCGLPSLLKLSEVGCHSQSGTFGRGAKSSRGEPQRSASCRQRGTQRQSVAEHQEAAVGCVAVSCEKYSSWHRIVSISFVRRDRFYDLFVPGPENYVAEGIVHHNTGVGKGRIIAGVITDNWEQGRRKHVWVSQKQNLLEDAGRDWSALGQDPKQLFHFDKIRKGEQPPSEGVAFITYDTLKSTSKDPAKPSNLDQLAKWLGPDFDGVIAFDEAHALSNAINIEGGRGVKDASARALAGVKLQQMLPKARVMYVSATGATEVSNLAYAERLGIWGRGTPFATKHNFIDQMQKGGVAAMESVAQSLKAMGSYGARSLSFDDGTPEGRVTYQRVTHKLSEDQKVTYDALADGWQSVLQNIDAALAVTGGADDKNAKSAARSQFWGAQQRFFNQIMTSMQTPSVIQAMEQDIAEGRSPVVQLVNTMEASTKRALLNRGEEQSLDDLDVSPRQTLMQYLDKSFPVHRYEEYEDQDGNVATRRVEDSQGNPVVDPEAAAMRDSLLDMVGTLRIPESPLDMIVNHFGHEKIAEATGRTQRLINKEQEDGSRKKELESRNIVSANAAEASDFQSGRKRALIFSDAGGTGRSYHADKDAENQDQRVHYMLQPGWRADNAVQGLGRTHRTNQAIAPTYRLVEIDELKAQKRFMSTIARRLDQLGALTKGQRQAGGGGLFSAADNLESNEAKAALENFFDDLQNSRIEGLNAGDVLKQLGYKQEEQEGKSKKQQGAMEAPPMGQFLNRLLSLRVETQGKVFDEFDKRLKMKVEKAVREGTLDQGVENFPAESVTRNSEAEVYKDAMTGAKVKHIVTTARSKAEKTKWDRLSQGEKPLGMVRNKQSGRVWAVYKGLDKTDAKTGRVTSQYFLRGPSGVQYRDQSELGTYGNFEKIEDAVAQPLWDREYAEAPDFVDREEHFLTGAILPIWDRIPGDKPKIYRLRTSDGQTVVGRHVPRKSVETMMKNLGISHSKGKHDVGTVHSSLGKGRGTATLANGWTLRPVMVQGQRRIEIKGPSLVHMGELKQDGVIQERINWETRFFVPTGETGVKVMERITKTRPITDVEEPEQMSRNSEAKQYIRMAPPIPREQPMRQLAEPIRRYSREDAEQYGWEARGKVGEKTKWRGTGEHKGQYRTQISEPGTGRAKKEGPKGSKPAPKHPVTEAVSDKLDQMVSSGELSPQKADDAKRKLAEPLQSKNSHQEAMRRAAPIAAKELNGWADDARKVAMAPGSVKQVGPIPMDFGKVPSDPHETASQATAVSEKLDEVWKRRGHGGREWEEAAKLSKDNFGKLRERYGLPMAGAIWSAGLVGAMGAGTLLGSVLVGLSVAPGVGIGYALDNPVLGMWYTVFMGPALGKGAANSVKGAAGMGRELAVMPLVMAARLWRTVRGGGLPDYGDDRDDYAADDGAVDMEEAKRLAASEWPQMMADWFDAASKRVASGASEEGQQPSRFAEPIQRFAKGDDAEQYGWARDPKSKAKKPKWVSDEGKSPRYQEKMPGSGRGEKKEGDGAKPKPKKKPVEDAASERLDEMVKAGEVTPAKAKAAQKKLAGAIKKDGDGGAKKKPSKDEEAAREPMPTTATRATATEARFPAAEIESRIKDLEQEASAAASAWDDKSYRELKGQADALRKHLGSSPEKRKRKPKSPAAKKELRSMGDEARASAETVAQTGKVKAGPVSIDLKQVPNDAPAASAKADAEVAELDREMADLDAHIAQLEKEKAGTAHEAKAFKQELDEAEHDSLANYDRLTEKYGKPMASAIWAAGMAGGIGGTLFGAALDTSAGALAGSLVGGVTGGVGGGLLGLLAGGMHRVGHDIGRRVGAGAVLGAARVWRTIRDTVHGSPAEEAGRKIMRNRHLKNLTKNLRDVKTGVLPFSAADEPEQYAADEPVNMTEAKRLAGIEWSRMLAEWFDRSAGPQLAGAIVAPPIPRTT